MWEGAGVPGALDDDEDDEAARKNHFRTCLFILTVVY
jgi:hypothetical protein